MSDREVRVSYIQVGDLIKWADRWVEVQAIDPARRGSRRRFVCDVEGSVRSLGYDDDEWVWLADKETSDAWRANL